MEKFHTTCIYCGCGCGLFLHVEDGRVVGASPSPLHPMSQGRLCIKGWLAGDFVGHPDRLKPSSDSAGGAAGEDQLAGGPGDHRLQSKGIGQ